MNWERVWATLCTAHPRASNFSFPSNLAQICFLTYDHKVINSHRNGQKYPSLKIIPVTKLARCSQITFTLTYSRGKHPNHQLRKKKKEKNTKIHIGALIDTPFIHQATALTRNYIVRKTHCAARGKLGRAGGGGAYIYIYILSPPALSRRRRDRVPLSRFPAPSPRRTPPRDVQCLQRVPANDDRSLLKIGQICGQRCVLYMPIFSFIFAYIFAGIILVFGLLRVSS